MFTHQARFFGGRGGGTCGCIAWIQSKRLQKSDYLRGCHFFFVCLLVLFCILEKVQIQISSNFWISCKYSDNFCDYFFNMPTDAREMKEFIWKQRC